MNKTLGKDDLLSGTLLKRELVPIPNKGASVWMRQMSGQHVLEFRRIVDSFRAEGLTETTFEQDIEIMTAVISFSVCDESGELLFDSPEEAKGLVVNDFNLLMDLGNKALEISGVKATTAGLSSGVADDLPNDQKNSLPDTSRASSRKRVRKS